MAELKHNLLKEAIAIKDYEERRSFIESLSESERAELAAQLGEAVNELVETFGKFWEQLHDAFYGAGCSMIALGETLRQNRRAH